MTRIITRWGMWPVLRHMTGKIRKIPKKLKKSVLIFIFGTFILLVSWRGLWYWHGIATFRVWKSIALSITVFCG